MTEFEKITLEIAREDADYKKQIHEARKAIIADPYNKDLKWKYTMLTKEYEEWYEATIHPF